MVIKKNTTDEIKCRICIDGEEIKKVKRFRYLGSIVTEDGRCINEVKSRIAQAKSTFTDLGNVLKTKKYHLKLRCTS